MDFRAQRGPGGLGNLPLHEERAVFHGLGRIEDVEVGRLPAATAATTSPSSLQSRLFQVESCRSSKLTRPVQGYNFKSLRDISPFLEPKGSGISALWARTTALRHNCFVVVGYPEKVDVAHKWPSTPEYYNSAIVVNPDGETVANYRKTHLYCTDETWALESPKGFFRGHIPELGNTAIGICEFVPWRWF